MLEKLETETMVTASDAKLNLEGLVSRVAENGEAILIEMQGKPSAAIISIEEYRQWRVLQKEEKRRDAIAAIRRIRAEFAEQNKDMTDDEIDKFADEVTREAVTSLVEKHGIRFE